MTTQLHTNTPVGLPLVSVLCLSMNHEHYVEQSANSVVTQIYSNIEIIYLDNFSSDATFEKADGIFSASGRPYKGFKREKSYGISANVNFLLQQATGKYISIISADDWWDANNLSEKIAFFEQHPEFGFLHGAGYIHYYNSGNIVKEDVLNHRSGWLLRELLRRNFVNTNGAIIRRDVLQQVGNFDEDSKLEDWDMWIRIAEKYPIGFFPKPLTYYGKQSDNLSDNKAYMKEGTEYIFKKYSHYKKEMAAAKDYYHMVDVYEAATTAPV
ncbi:MAG: glycosyltransferase family 2 protein, partial [Chitinophagaceae bacterium]